MQRFLILVFLFMPAIIFGQKEYKHEYRLELRAQQSSYTTNITDTVLNIGNNGILAVQVFNREEEVIPFSIIKIKNNKTDITIYSDNNGFVSTSIEAGTYSITIDYIMATTLVINNFIVRENSRNCITASLGNSNALNIAIIYSCRELSSEEIESLIDDLSNGREDNELIINNTCYFMWEI